MPDGGLPRWGNQGNPEGAEVSGGAAGALLAVEEFSRLSLLASVAPAEKEEMVDYSVRAIGVNVQERRMDAGGGSRKSEAVVDEEFLTYVRTEKE